MGNISLKYRIAVLIFLLEAMMMAFVLSTTLNYYFDANRKLSNGNEVVLLNLLSDLARIALFTAEYDELQPYIEQVVTAPSVERVILLNNDNRVVVSSDVADIGKVDPTLDNENHQFWRTQVISNASGNLGRLAINFSDNAFVAANRKAIDLGISTALAGMIVIAIIGVVIGYLLTRRLETLKNAAQKLADGDLSVNSDISGNDEIAILSQAFNGMARNIEKVVADLRDRKADLTQAHEQLEKRIIERTEELSVARDEAQYANKTKSNFLANMSHELRTPLNAIMGYSQLLTEVAEEENLGEIQGDLEKIYKAGAHLLGVINDILDLSKIEAGKVQLEFIEFSTKELVKDVVDHVLPLAHKNNNKLNIACDQELGTMNADLTKVRQILINLLGNAAKFTENGVVTLAVSKHRENGVNWVTFAIKDTGIGITKEQLGRLFNEFTQADVSTTRKYGGTGLGLTISKRICELMGGSIDVTSVVHEGSTFSVKLPMSAALGEQADCRQPPIALAHTGSGATLTKAS